MLPWLADLDCARAQGGNAASQTDSGLRDPRHGTQVAGLHSTSDGACADEMDRNIWQVTGRIQCGRRPENERRIDAEHGLLVKLAETLAYR